MALLADLATQRPARLSVAALVLVSAAAWAAQLAQFAATPAAPAPSMAMDGMAGMSGMAGMDSMSGMAGNGAGATADWAPRLAVYTASWAIMMTAMMLPSAAPMVLLFDAASRRSHPGLPGALRTTVFAAGYLLVWAGMGIPIFFAGELLARLDTSSGGSLIRWGLVGLLFVAGVYQFTPLKQVCLSRCQSPAGFLMTHWYPGLAGVLRTSLLHGAYCIGCCWAFMVILVAVGAMSLPWVLLVTALVAVEKLLPAWTWSRYTAGTALLGFAAVAAVLPQVVVLSRL